MLDRNEKGRTPPIPRTIIAHYARAHLHFMPGHTCIPGERLLSPRHVLPSHVTPAPSSQRSPPFERRWTHWSPQTLIRDQQPHPSGPQASHDSPTRTQHSKLLSRRSEPLEGVDPEASRCSSVRLQLCIHGVACSAPASAPLSVSRAHAQLLLQKCAHLRHACSALRSTVHCKGAGKASRIKDARCDFARFTSTALARVINEVWTQRTTAAGVVRPDRDLPCTLLDPKA